MKVFIQRKILFRETVLSTYTHTHTHRHPHTRASVLALCRLMEVIHDDSGLTHRWSDRCRHWADYVAKAVNKDSVVGKL